MREAGNMTAGRKGRKGTRPKGDFELVIPTRAGRDLYSTDGTNDAHIRIERYKEFGTDIYVDLFDSSVANASEAHIRSESFQYGASGAKEATEFLQENGFRVAVMIR